MRMLRKFLRSGLSAAGVSHVVTEKSYFRRLIWVVALLIISAAMLCMTYKVLQEYLKYPTVMHMRRISMKEMEFPAVTVCSYNLIPRHNLKDANLEDMEEMQNVLQKLPTYRIPLEEKIRCLKDPLCQWSRFLDKCFCDQKACGGTECYPHANKTICVCSKPLCKENVTIFVNACSTVQNEGKEECVCRTDYDYSLYKTSENEQSSDFLETLENMDVSPGVKTLLKNIKSSNITNLRDVEKFLKPNITVRDNYGIAYHDLFLSCTFGSEPCNLRRDVSTLYSPTFGKCYTFNYAGVEGDDSVKIVRHAGTTHGLQLLLKSPRSNTFPLFSINHGVRVVVHEPRSLPFASANGNDIRAGDMTSVVVRYTELNRLGPPWNNCALDGDNDTTSYLEKPYSMLGCDRNCVNEHIFQRCKCFFDRVLIGSLIPRRTHICTLQQEKCYMGVIFDKYQKKVQCRCPPPCREKGYEVKISAGKVNREYFRVLKKVKTLKLMNGRPAVAKPEFDLGLMGLQVYFGSFVITNTSEDSIYSWEFLVANVGGNLGLFLGLSLITFIEIAEFIVDIAAETFFRGRSRRK